MTSPVRPGRTGNGPAAVTVGTEGESWDASWRAAFLVIAVGVSVGLRLGLAGSTGAASLSAALAFSCCLLVVAVVLRPARRPLAGHRSKAIRSLLIGLAGFGGLVLGPVLTTGVRLAGRPHVGNAAAWAVTVALVAVAEEAAIRGVLFTAVHGLAGPVAALAVTTLTFALIHVPFYGFHAVPLDLAVGAWLGGLRLWSGGAGAPTVAHVLADLSAFWL